MTDDVDEVKVSLSVESSSVVEGTGTVTYKVTVDQELDDDLVVKLDNGQEVTISAGTTEQTFTRVVDSDDVYVDQDGATPEISVALDSASVVGETFEKLTVDKTPVTVDVTDDVDEVKVSLSVESSSVVEGTGTVTYKVTVDQELDDDLVVKLDNGQEVTISAGTTEQTFTRVVDSDDVYVDQDGATPEISVALDSASVVGETFEKLTVDKTPVTVDVTDDVDEVKVSLSVESSSVVEGTGTVTYKVTVDQELDDDLVVKLDNGQEVTISAGTTEQTFTRVVDSDDVYVDQDGATPEISVALDSASVVGETFEKLTVDKTPVTVDVTDDVDEVKVSLSVESSSVVEGTGTVTYKVTVDQELDDDLVVKLDNGQEVTISAGTTEQTFTRVVDSDDVYVDQDGATPEISVALDSASVVGETFEKLTVDKTPVTVDVTDDVDEVKVSLSVESSSVVEGTGTVTYKVTVDQELDDDLVVKLDNGQEVTISAGTTEQTFTRVVDSDDVYVDQDGATPEISVALDSASVVGETFEKLTVDKTPVTVDVTDDVDEVKVSLSVESSSVVEGTGTVTYKVTVDQELDDDLVVKLDNGQEVTISAGTTEQTFTRVVDSDDVYVDQDGATPEISVALDSASVVGETFEKLTVDKTPVTVDVTDDVDEVKVSLSVESSSVVEGTGTVTYKVTVDQELDDDLVVKLDNGQEVTISAGTTEQTFTRVVDSDDVYVDQDGATPEISVALDSASVVGETFEKLTVDKTPVTVDVTDDVDEVKVSLSVESSSVVEGTGTVTYKVTVDQELDDDLVVKLDNGQEVTISAGTTEQTFTRVVDSDDVYVDQDGATPEISVALDSASVVGETFEKLTVDKTPVTVDVTDDVDEVKVSLSVESSSVVEGTGTVTYKVTVDQELDDDLVVKLDNGQEVTISAGTTEQTFTRVVDSDDVYVDQDGATPEISVALDSASVVGETFEKLTVDKTPVTVDVTDDVDEVKVSLSVESSSVVEGTGTVTYKVTVDQELDDDLVVKLDNGQEVTISAGTTEQTFTRVVDSDDVYVDQDGATPEISVALDSASVVGETFEKLTVDKTPVTVDVTDDVDEVKVSLSVESSSVVEGTGTVTYKVTVDQELDDDLVVKLDNGQEVTISAGTTEQTFTRVVDSDDVYVDQDGATPEISVALDSASVVGETFEKLTVDKTPVTVDVTDDVDEVKVSLSVESSSVVEGTGTVTYKVTVDQELDDDLVVKLDNGQEVTISAGTTEQTFTRVVDSDDVYVDQDGATPEISVALDSASVVGETFEKLTVDKTPVTVDVTDDVDEVKVSLSVESSSVVEGTGTVTYKVTVDQELDDDLVVKLDNGQEVTISAGTTEQTFTRVVDSDDVYVDQDGATPEISVALDSASVVGETFEKLTVDKTPVTVDVTDDVDEVKVSLSVESSSVVEGTGTVTYKVTVDQELDDDLVVKLDNGQEVTISAGTTEQTFTRVVDSDDVYVDQDGATPEISVALDSASVVGETFEKLTVDKTPVTVDVTDDVDEVKVSLSVESSSVVEGTGTVTYKVTVDQELDDDLVVKLDNGQEVTISAGTTEQTFTRVVDSDDVYVDQDGATPEISVALDSASVVGETFEKLTVDKTPVTVDVTDDVDEVKVSLSVESSSVVEGTGTVTYKVTVDQELDDDLVVKLDNGQEVTISAGTTEQTFTRVVDSDDVYVDQDGATPEISVALDSASVVGETFEKLTVDKTPVTVDVTDDVDEVKVSLSVESSSVVEGTGTVTYKVTVDQELDDDLVVKLDNGQEVTISAGTTEQTFTRVVDSDDVYVDQDGATPEISVALDSASVVGETFEKLTVDKTPVTVDVTDDVDEVKVSLSVESSSVVEGTGTVTYKVTVDQELDDDLVVKLDNGQEVTISAGTTEQTFTRVVDSDDVYVDQDGATPEISVALDSASVVGETFEKLTVDKTPVTVDVTDDVDEVKVSLSVESSSVVEGTGTVTYKVTVDQELDDDLVVKLDNGQEVTISAGTTEQTFTRVVDSDDVYVDQDGATPEISVALDSASVVGETFEKLTVDKTPVTVDVTDDVDEVKVSLSVESSSVVEGTGTVTYKVTVDQELDDDLVVKLDNGQEVTISAGTTEQTFTRVVDSDDVYVDQDGATPEISVALDSASVVGETFEKLTVDKTPVTVDVTDDVDEVKVSLSVESSSVVEGTGTVTYKVTVDQELDDDLVVKLDNGQEVTISAGTTEQTFTRVVDSDDVYVDQDGATPEISVALDSASVVGETFEKLTVDKTPVTVDVTDDVDEVKVSLSVESSSVVEGTGTVTYKVTVDQELDDDLVVKLDNGQEVTISAGTTEQTFTRVVDSDDVYVDQDGATPEISVALDSASVVGETFEKLTVDKTPVTVDVTDDVDEVKVSLSVESSSVVEGTGTVTYKVTVDQELDDDLVVKLDNGQEVTISAGTTEQTFTRVVDSDDVYVDQDGATPEISVALDSASVVGETFEKLTVDKTPVTVDVTDDVDEVKVSLSVESSSVVEGTGTVTYKVTVDQELDDDLVVKLDNGQEVTISAGTTEQTFTRVVDSDDVYVDQDGATPEISVALDSASVVGETFEKLTVDKTPVTVDVTDDVDEVKVSLSVESSSVVEGTGTVTYKVTVDQELDDDLVVKLDNGQEVTISAGTTEQTFTRVVDSDDVYVDQDGATPEISVALDSASVVGETFEKLTVDKTPVTVDVTDDVDLTTVSISGTVTKAAVIDVSNVLIEDHNGITVYALNPDGSEGDISINNNPVGFGVDGSTTGSGADSELGNADDSGNSEKIVVEFDSAVISLDVALAWRNPGETAKVSFYNEDEFGNDVLIGWATVSGGENIGGDIWATVTYYDENDNFIKEVTTQGGTDVVDDPYTFEPGNGETFTKAVFSAPGHDDDYLINEIIYKEVVDASEITDVLSQDGEVTLQITTSNPPQTPATAIVLVGDTEYSVGIGTNGIGTLNVPMYANEELSATVLRIEGGNFEGVDVSVATVDIPESVVDTVIANEAGLSSDGIEASLGGYTGTSIELTDKTGNSVIGETVVSKVTDVNGNVHEVNAKYQGEELEYQEIGGVLTAVSKDTNTSVFTISENITDNTYKVTMLKPLDPITSSVNISENQVANISLDTTGGSNSGITVSLSSNNGNVYESNNNIGVNHNDGSWGADRSEIEDSEKLTMTFNTLYVITKVEVDLNSFGNNDDAKITVVDDNGTRVINVDSNDYTSDIVPITGNNIQTISFEAPGSNDEYNIADSIKVTYSETVNIDNSEQTFEFGAQIIDGSDQQFVTFDVTVDNDDTLEAKIGDVVVGRTSDSLIDTLAIDTDSDTIDFTDIAQNAKDIEAVDFTDGQAQRVDIDLEDVVDMTDDDNDLVVIGENGDEIDLKEDLDNDGVNDWQQSQTATTLAGYEGTFDAYTNTQNPNVTVFVDTDISVDDTI